MELWCFGPKATAGPGFEPDLGQHNIGSFTNLVTAKKQILQEKQNTKTCI